MGIVPDLNTSHLKKWGVVTHVPLRSTAGQQGTCPQGMFFPPCTPPPAPRLLLVQGPMQQILVSFRETD